VLKHLRNSEDFEQKNLLQKGFTLVELLVVIVILGILAAVVVFAVSGSTDEAKSSACKSDASSALSAVEAYRAKTGNYPTAWSDVTSGTNQFLRKAPANYDLNTDGTLALKADSGTYKNPCNAQDLTDAGN
jgi:prepilin-type N-terminal cleavage/methylation domain-containing protein